MTNLSQFILIIYLSAFFSNDVLCEKRSYFHKILNSQDSAKANRLLNYFSGALSKQVEKGVKGIGNLPVISDIANDLDDNLENMGLVGDALVALKDNMKFIVPGTKWCGQGDRAHGDEDLGFFSVVDSCCRSHDKCQINILAGETKYGLTNTGTYTRSHCSCDEEFYNCLKTVKSATAYKVGVIYFNVLGPKCFKEEYPIITCSQKSILNKCQKYELNTKEAEKMYQWFDNKSY